MDEADWDAVVRNCNLLYGWKINKRTNAIERAPMPAFRLRSKAPERTGVPTPTAPPPRVQPPKEAKSDDGEISDSESTTEDERELAPAPAPKAVSTDDIHLPVPKKPDTIPSFVIDDASRIEVVTLKTEAQECMAKSNFSSSSIEASV